MDRSAVYHGNAVVDLSSDSEDGRQADDELEFFDARLAQEPADNLPRPPSPFYDFGVNGHETIDLTAIPDIDVPPSDPVLRGGGAPPLTSQSSKRCGDAQLVTEAACLQMVLGVLPDISVDYVLKVIQERTTDDTRTLAMCEQVVTYLLDVDSYPKEADEAKNKKRKRDDDDNLSDYEKVERDPEVTGYEHDA